MSFIDGKHLRARVFLSKIDNPIPQIDARQIFRPSDEFIAPIIVQISPGTSHSFGISCDALLTVYDYARIATFELIRYFHQLFVFL